ncbi:MAG: hypothetical protein J6334_12025, partial [Kiritimatiellae bacterium]|nr:hypothetical protein [Kiritimatiellia bacterium]
MWKGLGWLMAGVLVALCGQAGYLPPPLVFDSPAESDRGAMILGNGEVGAIAWVSADGTLHTVLQRSDTWNEAGGHVKAGAIDYVTGSPVDAGSFHQELSLAAGSFEIRWRSGGMPVSVHYRIQHGEAPFAVCAVTGAPKAAAKVVNWRLYPEGAKRFGCGWEEIGNQFDRTSVDGKPLTFLISADRLVPGGWCHVNRNETVAEMMAYYDKWQATGDLGKPALLANRVFGGLTREARAGDRVLFLSAITAFHPCGGAEEWIARTGKLLEAEGWGLDDEAAKRAAHQAGWAAFWARSHLEVSPAENAVDSRPKVAYPYNPQLPVSYGRDSKGGTRFTGELSVDPASRVGTDGLLFAATFTAEDVQSNQRLFDNITPGRADGSLVDILNGRLRLLIAGRTFFHPSPVPARRAVAVRAEVNPYGEITLTLDGVNYVASRSVPISSAEACATVTQAWLTQRYTTACAGKGALPIRFNGSLFTTSEKGNPDYRRWGHGYWWQNTRLPYFPMFAAGDFEFLHPLFRMYTGLTPFHLRRTQKYLGHGGAYFPECMQPWGDHFTSTYGARYDWKDRPDKLQDGGWHKYEWVGQLELSLMLLDYRDYTQDDGWFKEKALPSIRAYLRFFDEHYSLDGKGRYHMEPAQALETWWSCTNPMPEIAGLTRVTERLLALPEETLAAGDRDLFTRIRSRIPELPTRRLPDGRVVFAPAASFAEKRNCEHPELYCVFPFRLCSFEKPNADLGRAAYEVRQDKNYSGWKQEELFAAYLGMADEAASHLVNRVCNNSAEGFRWPAYWGPNFDWRPDQCAGGNIQNILQSMLMQCEGEKIFLLPAWPKAWNCSFRLHAPRRTTVEGRVENGVVKELVVSPESRRGDVIVWG